MSWIWGEKERALTSKEVAFINNVFRGVDLPSSSTIRIRNGLSTTGTPFTTRGGSQSMLVRSTRIKTDGDFLIMVGPLLFQHDLSETAPALLVHEMTHVWQYFHRTLSEIHGLAAHAIYYLSGKVGGGTQNRLYEYQLGDSWINMGFEGQAQLVEDWYKLDHLSDECDRFVYIKDQLFNTTIEEPQLLECEAFSRL